MSIQLTYTFATQQDLLAHLAIFRTDREAATGTEVRGALAPKSAQAPAPAPGQTTAAADAAPKKTAAAKAPAAQSAATPAPASTAATTTQETGSEGNVAPAGTSVAASTTASTASSSEPASSVDYPTLQKAVFALAGKSREAAASVAASFGVKTFKELDASKWGEALAAVNAKLAEV